MTREQEEASAASAVCPACGGACVWIMNLEDAAQDDEDAHGDEQYQARKEGDR
jgi:hypothetical protein